MKKCVLSLLAAMVLTGCEKEIMNNAADGDSTTVSDGGTIEKRFTFTVKGDFTNDWKPVTRGYLSADGKDMTDLWLFDYVDGQLVQQLHQQDNAADDFGRPVLNLTYGTHHLYFVASRGTSPVLNVADHTITWSSVRDTFWKDYEVSVVSTSNGNRAVTLDRVVTKLMLTFTDAISSDAFSINFTPATWYYGLDYTTGEPTEATTSQTIVTTLPESYKGQSDVVLSYFSLSSSGEWTSNVSLNSKDADGNIIGQANMTAVPFVRNRQTEYSGPLFTSGGALSLSLDDEWDASATGSW